MVGGVPVFTHLDRGHHFFIRHRAGRAIGHGQGHTGNFGGILGRAFSGKVLPVLAGPVIGAAVKIEIAPVVDHANVTQVPGVKIAVVAELLAGGRVVVIVTVKPQVAPLP